MKHVQIPVEAIHPNPHRDFKRNPIREDQVEKIIDSIGRTGFWDNVVVREHPERKGEYQLAYGHNRIEAVKRVDITEVRLPVADLSDWDMYLAMVDENETQQEVTPAIAFENIEAGVVVLENAFRQIGPDGTWEQFNRALGRVVPAGTTLRGKHNGGFEQARNAFFRGEGIGRRFIVDSLPAGKMRKDTVVEVLNSHYAEQREAAKKEQERKKRAEAEAKAKEAEEAAAKAKAEFDDHHFYVFKVPREVNSKGTQVITFRPDYQVNPFQTAQEIADRLAKKRERERMRSSYNCRQVITGDPDKVFREMMEDLLKIRDEGLPAAHMALPLSYEEAP